ncbi:hypothetical protein Nepgr_012719 [Nepenthes gracilis]|uniref:Uncharacterized protein n=1 Tax=Nepenthes gracilis TaxID=150966 RepID=A0AAD3SGM7_NEPGR|nr:hypothetical protein Nepgr_012719 [Nepenthes gracilis]
MAKCYRSDVGSLILEQRSTRDSAVTSGGYFRLWSLFSGAAFRRRIIDTVRCSGGLSRHAGADVEDLPTAKTAPKPQKRAQSGRDDDPSRSGSEKLADLLNLSGSSSPVSTKTNGNDNASDDTEIEKDAQVKKKMERFKELSSPVRMLRSDCDEERKNGAKVVRLLAKEDSEARSTLAMLGAIPPLVGMVDDGGIHAEFQTEALYALLNLGIGNELNKAAIVQAGAVHKMLKLIESSNGSPDASVSEAIVANFLALSALDANKPIIGSSGAIPFLVNTLKDLNKKSSAQAKHDSLRALYNISILPSNIPLILETDLIQYLMNSLGDMEVSERILSILSNVVSTPKGRKTVSTVPDAFTILIDVLNWTDSPGCQEKACYILMVMAHKAYADRQTMIEAGIVSALLELTLIGSTLAQKRASRILECLRVDKGKQVSGRYNGGASAVVSAPMCGSSSSAVNLDKGLKEGQEEEVMMSEERKAVKRLVHQSLQNNMRRIVKRANLPQDFVPSEHLKSLASSSTSKSLPF